VVNLAGQQGYRRSDRELADAALAAVKQLQDAMDDLIKAGLTVEPAIKIVENRFSNLGLSVDSYLINLNVWRKLS
jgi:hypothetical protein